MCLSWGRISSTGLFHYAASGGSVPGGLRLLRNGIRPISVSISSLPQDYRNSTGTRRSLFVMIKLENQAASNQAGKSEVREAL